MTYTYFIIFCFIIIIAYKFGYYKALKNEIKKHVDDFFIKHQKEMDKKDKDLIEEINKYEKTADALFESLKLSYHVGNREEGLKYLNALRELLLKLIKEIVNRERLDILRK